MNVELMGERSGVQADYRAICIRCASGGSYEGLALKRRNYTIESLKMNSKLKGRLIVCLNAIILIDPEV
jgi:hypothetical protein